MNDIASIRATPDMFVGRFFDKQDFEVKFVLTSEIAEFVKERGLRFYLKSTYHDHDITIVDKEESGHVISEVPLEDEIFISGNSDSILELKLMY